jgi:hypothetical protein
MNQVLVKSDPAKKVSVEVEKYDLELARRMKELQQYKGET